MTSASRPDPGPLGPNSAAPRISVIIPVYNVETYIGACIDSLRQQSFADFEALIIDDGSTDDSHRQALAAIGDDPRFRMIRQDNQGLSGARNTGLDAARGEMIAFVDSDDRVMANFLQRLHDALEDSGADWAACAVRFCLPDGTGQPHSAIHGAADLSQHKVQRLYHLNSWADVLRHFPSAWNKLYRRSLIEGLRFDDGTWFEDHGFFQRAAARTDHLLHIPEALYLQTQGRDGQITGADDDRVFEQFDVLRRMRRDLDASHDDAHQAFARIASRLIYERSTALRAPARRARFAAASADFLAEAGIAYSTAHDPEITQSWALEMAGTLPLSIVIPWHGKSPELLQASLDALTEIRGPGHEIVIVCDTGRAARKARMLAASLPQARVLHRRVGRGAGPARNHGLAAARGQFVTFLDAGDLPHPWAYLRWVETMLRNAADMGLSQYRLGPLPRGETYTGFHDPQLLTGGLPADGHPVPMTPSLALTLEAQISAKIFNRDFLTTTGLRFGKGARPDWSLCIAAALDAGRVAYNGWAGIEISAAPDAREVWQGRYSSIRLWRGHAAMLAGLPRRIRKELPGGWQRRLYARALREQLHFGTGSQADKTLLLIGAAMGAAISGFGRPGVKPAGLDPFVGPKQALILDPRLLIHAVISRLRGRETVLRDNTRALQHAATHQAFPLQEQGLFRFRTDFHDHDFANLTFHTPQIVVLPFHLSLRFHENLIVCNDTRPDGTWRAERHVPYILPRGGTEITVILRRHSARVLADGKQILHLRRRRLWRRGGLRDLDQITTFTIQGGLRPSELLPQPPATGRLLLDPRLQLRARPAPGDTAGGHRLVAEGAGDGPEIALPIHPCADGDELLAFLPGRIWADLPAGADLNLTLTRPNGNPLAKLTLSRTRMAERIAALMDLQIDREDASLVLLMLEHLQHGELMGLMPPRARTRALELAANFGLSDTFVPAVRETDAEPPATPPAIDAHTAQFHDALAQFTRSQQQDPAPDPLRVLADIALDPEPRRGLFLTLSEFFCQEDRDVQGFVDLARKLQVPLPEPDALPDPAGDPWTASAMLPFLMCSDQAEAAGALMTGLAAPSDGWVLTPPVAWTLRQVLKSGRYPDKVRYDILRSFMQFVLNRAEYAGTDGYWERTPCRELTGAAADMALAADRLPYPENRRAPTFCQQAYGLSRAFWAQIEAACPPNHRLPAPLDAAHRQFCLLMAQADRAALDPAAHQAAAGALEYFTRTGTAGVERLRREILGPGHGSPAAYLAGGQTNWQVGDSPAIRQMAMPGPNQGPGQDQGQDQDSAALSDTVARTLPDLYAGLPRAPYFQMQCAAGAALDGLWRASGQGEISYDLRDQLNLLAQEQSGFLGLALGITLLGWRNAPEDADWLTSRIAALPRDQRPRLAQAPAIRMALAGLRDRAPDHATLVTELIRPDRPLPAPGPADCDGLPAASPVFDTLVVVFSCKPYLDSRIRAMREGWLGDLKALGVPYVVVIGDGDGRREGDVVHLEAPDDYEGLPQKTLAAIAWVRDRTRYTHMVKIDDDCFLNAPLFFHSLSYRKFDYYGRRLTRAPGQMDRAWHQSKSSSDRGRLEFDKSYEPSSYADGGSGYALSRDAMEAALDAAASPEGQQLIQRSFMEDKMLGDLLALRGISVEEEDYRVSVRRRSHRDAIPVAAWHNSFFASRNAPIQLVHLDTHLYQAEAQARLAAPGLWPRKIWPSYQEVRLGYQSNALELISHDASVEAAREAEVAVVACMRNEMFMLPHFLAHYRTLGVSSFLIADNASDDGTLEYLAAQPDVALFSVDTDYNKSRYGVAWQQAMLAAFRMDKWSLVADADELLVWQQPQKQTLPQLLARPEFATAEAARIFMLDMYPQGALSEADFASGDPFGEAGFADAVPFLTDSPMRGPYCDQPAWTSALRHRLIPGSAPNLFTAQKLALLRYRPWMRLSAGLHFVADVQLAKPELFFAHFKYNAAFRAKAQAEVERGQHFNDAEEYRKYLALASEGRDVIHDPDLSVRWYDSPFVKRRLQAG